MSEKGLKYSHLVSGFFILGVFVVCFLRQGFTLRLVCFRTSVAQVGFELLKIGAVRSDRPGFNPGPVKDCL